MDKGHLVYLYNMMIIEQYEARSAQPLAASKHRITVDTTIAGPGKPCTALITPLSPALRSGPTAVSRATRESKFLQ
jgi:hypothetical protein